MKRLPHLLLTALILFSAACGHEEEGPDKNIFGYAAPIIDYYHGDIGTPVGCVIGNYLFDTPKYLYNESPLPLGRLDGDAIRRGTDPNGEILGRIDGNRLLSPAGKVLAITNGHDIIKGADPYGTYLGHINSSQWETRLGLLAAAWFMFFPGDNYIDRHLTYVSSQELDPSEFPHYGTNAGIVEGNNFYDSSIPGSKPLMHLSSDTVFETGEAGKALARISGDSILFPDGNYMARLDGQHIRRYEKIIGTIQGDNPAAGPLGAVQLYTLMQGSGEYHPTYYIYEGYSSNIIADVKQKRIRAHNRLLDLANIQGNYIRRGLSTSETVIATVEGRYVYKGKGTRGPIIARIEGQYVYAGSSGISLLCKTDGGGIDAAALGAVYCVLLME